MRLSIDVAARYGAARLAVALSELRTTELAEPARHRLAFLMEAARRDLTDAADSFDCSPDDRIGVPSTFPAELCSGNVIAFRPRVRV